MANTLAQKLQTTPRSGRLPRLQGLAQCVLASTRLLAPLLTVLALLGPSGCAYDDDSDFVHKPLAAYYLHTTQQDTNAQGYQLARWNAAGWAPAWHNTLQQGVLTDAQLEGDRLWLLYSQPATLLAYNLRDQRLEQRLDLHSSRENALGDSAEPGWRFRVGAHKLLLANGADSSLYWVPKHDLRLNNVQVVALPAKPGLSAYKGEVFWLTVGDSLWILQERAEALLARHALAGQPRRLQVDDFGGAHVLSTPPTLADTPAVLQTFDAFAHTQRSQQPVAYRDFRLAPYYSAPFGQEWTGDLYLTDSSLSNLDTLGPVQDFDLNFRFSELDFRRNDSLFRYNLRSDSLRLLAHLGAPLRKALYWNGPQP